VVVVRACEGGDGDETIAARPVFYQDRLAPARGQTIREQPRRDVRAGCRPERHDEAHGPRRIIRRGRAGAAWQIENERDEEK